LPANPFESEGFSTVNYNGLLDNQYSLDFGSYEPFGGDKRSEVTYLIQNGEVVATREDTNIEYYAQDGSINIIDNGATVWKFFDDNGVSTINITLNEVFEKPIETVMNENPFGDKIAAYGISDDGLTVVYRDGKTFVIEKERLAEFNFTTPGNVALPDHALEFIEMKQGIIDQFNITDIEGSSIVLGFDDYVRSMFEEGILPNEISGEQDIFNTSFEPREVVEGYEISISDRYGINYNPNEDNIHTLISNPNTPGYTYQRYLSKQILESNPAYEMTKFSIFETNSTSENSSLNFNGRSCAYNMRIGEGLEKKDIGLTFSVYNSVDIEDPQKIHIYFTARLDSDEGFVYQENVVRHSYSKELVDTLDPANQLNKINDFLNNGSTLDIMTDIIIDFGPSLNTGNAAIDIIIRDKMSQCLSADMWSN